MTEANYRLTLGFLILVFLYFDLQLAMYALMGIVFLEGLTGLHIPFIISRFRYGSDYVELMEINPNPRFSIYAIRALRIVVVVFLLISYVFFNEPLWFVPWNMAFLLYVSGITNLCPVTMFLRKLGFR